MCIKGSFTRYFEKDSADPYKDLLTISGVHLVLSDEEFSSLLAQINKLIEANMNKEMNKNRKNRELYIISAPVEERV